MAQIEASTYGEPGGMLSGWAPNGGTDWEAQQMVGSPVAYLLQCSLRSYCGSGGNLTIWKWQLTCPGWMVTGTSGEDPAGSQKLWEPDLVGLLEDLVIDSALSTFSAAKSHGAGGNLILENGALSRPMGLWVSTTTFSHKQ